MRNTGNGVEFTRQELYDLLTELPISRIAGKYNLDYDSLSRAIKMQKIPYRSSGDWTDIHMGRYVKREPLHGDFDKKVFVLKAMLKNMLMTDAVVNNTKRLESKSNGLMSDNDSGGDYYPDHMLESVRKALQTSTIDVTKTLSEAFDISSDSPYYSSVELEDLSLSVRPYNALRRSGVRYIDQLLSMTIDQLINVRNIGAQSISEVIIVTRRFCLKHESEMRRMKENALNEVSESENMETTGLAFEEKSEASGKEIFVKLMTEFYKLNSIGQELAVETITAMTKVERFQAKE